MAFEQIIRFAEEHLSPYRINGDELVPELCPICQGGDHGDCRTFAINLAEGVYICHRGTCGAKGRFEDLVKAMGADATSYRQDFGMSAVKKAYVLPETQLFPPTDEIRSYFASRKISAATLEAFRIAADTEGNIVFPFYRNNVLEYVKFRKPRKPMKGDRKEWQAKGTRPILFGMDSCSFAKPLIITEGCIDTMSLYEAGVTNVVSVPCGATNFDWIEPCWDWLEQFSTIVLFGDNDEPGRKMVNTLAKRLDEARCKIVDEYPLRPDGKECKDANEILYFCGDLTLIDTLESAKPVPLKGIIQLADVVPYDPTSVPRIKTMVPELDTTLGGLVEGG